MTTKCASLLGTYIAMLSKVGFIGKEQDEESSYFQLGVRQYDPAIGRFLSVDPLWEYFPNYNPYHYSYNNPVSFKDPTGLAPEPNEKEDEILIKLIGVVIVIAGCCG